MPRFEKEHVEPIDVDEDDAPEIIPEVKPANRAADPDPEPEPGDLLPRPKPNAVAKCRCDAWVRCFGDEPRVHCGACGRWFDPADADIKRSGEQ